MRKNRGFSLMELMIAVAIIGILASIAYPSYINSVIKGNRGNAKSFLLEVVQREQQFLLDNRAYATGSGALTALNMTAPEDFTRFYTLTVTAVAGPPIGFQARATPKAGTRQAKDGWLEINNTGAKSSQYPDKW